MALADLISEDFVAGLILLLFVLILVASGIRVIREWERAPVLRLGRFTGMKGPGIFYIIPFVDRIPNIISLRIQTIPFRTEQTLTKDNVPVNVDAIMFFQAVDVEKVVLNVERYLDATTWAAQTTLREVMGKVSFDELLAEREKVGVEARNIIDEKTEHWGIKVSSVEIKDIAIPHACRRRCHDKLQRNGSVGRGSHWRWPSMRRRRKWLTPQTSTRRIFALLELRWMNILYELGLQSKGTLMLVPTNTPTAGVSMGFPPLGIASIQDLAKEKKDQETQ